MADDLVMYPSEKKQAVTSPCNGSCGTQTGRGRGGDPERYPSPDIDARRNDPPCSASEDESEGDDEGNHETCMLYEGQTPDTSDQKQPDMSPENRLRTKNISG